MHDSGMKMTALKVFYISRHKITYGASLVPFAVGRLMLLFVEQILKIV